MLPLLIGGDREKKKKSLTDTEYFQPARHSMNHFLFIILFNAKICGQYYYAYFIDRKAEGWEVEKLKV